MFYYRTSFSKKAIFLEKTAKNPFVGGHGSFEGRGHLGTKINITFFVGIDVLNIFYLTIFSKKNNIFQKISEKLFFGASPFLRERGGSDDKNEYNHITFFLVNGVPNTVFKFFPQKYPYRLT